MTILVFLSYLTPPFKNLKAEINKLNTPKSPYAFLLTKCLGQEEELIHKEKEKGPIYQLNQLMLNVFLNLPQVKLKDKFYKPICTQVKIGVSIEILEIIFKNFENAFAFAGPNDSIPIHSRDKEDFIRRLPELFNHYLTVIKVQSPTHDCLEQNIPELKKFYTDLQYLEESLNFKTLAQRDNQLIKIIEQLKNKDKFFESCKK